jgi:hypothetical protein
MISGSFSRGVFRLFNITQCLGGEREQKLESWPRARIEMEVAWIYPMLRLRKRASS